jgi:triacylglycerol lipase
MNPPVPNHYDLENARQLVGLAADSYKAESVFGCVAVEDKRTDTRAVVYRAGEEDVVVAFRGTRSLRNFVTDVCARRAECRGGPREAEVHEGFQQALNSIYDALYPAAAELAGGTEGARMWITGHSLGGALAKLFAARCKLRIAGVYTFGEPRVGNAGFRDYYNALLKSCTFRVVDGEDFITRIPWLLGAYRHCGTEVFYDALNVPRVEPGWRVKGVSDLLGTWREWSRDGRVALLEDHHVGRYAGLFGAGTNGRHATHGSYGCEARGQNC